MRIIVGLGNPGEKYKDTRHNVGFMVVDKIIQNSKFKIQNDNAKFKINKKFQAEILDVRPQKDLLLVKPQTFMNESGKAVKKVLQGYNSTPTRWPKDSPEVFSKLYIVHDDLDISLGEYKIQFGKGAAGHHGVESIISELKTKDFWRIRVGTNPVKGENFISLRGQGIDPQNFVLQPFNKTEKIIIDKAVNNIACEILI